MTLQQATGMIGNEVRRSTDAGVGLVKRFGPIAVENAIVAAAILAFFLSKAAELVIRVTRQHRENQPLRALLLTFVGSFTLAGLFSFQSLFLDCLCLTIAGLLVMGAKAVEVYYDPIFQRVVNYEVLIDDVLHHPWFSIDR